jgi:hypothetical protein
MTMLTNWAWACIIGFACSISSLGARLTAQAMTLPDALFLLLLAGLVAGALLAAEVHMVQSGRATQA